MQSRFVFRDEMFRHAIRVVDDVVREVETAVRRQLIEGIDLAFAGFQRSADVILRKFFYCDARSFQRCDAEGMKFCVSLQLARIFAIQPMQFVGIERGVAAHDIV